MRSTNYYINITNRYLDIKVQILKVPDNIIYTFFVLGLIKQVVQHSAQTIYTRVTKDEDNAE